MMLSIFEDEAREQIERLALKDIACASCAASGRRLTGEPCDVCGGAAWLVLRDHEPPCSACHHPLRAARPAPSNIWPLPESPISETEEAR